MTARLEKRLQLLTMFLTLLLGTFGSSVLSENSVYPLTVLAGPFAAGVLFVFLTRRTSRNDPTSLALSVVGTIGLGVIGMVLSNTLDDSKPHAWIVECHDKLWGPVGDGAYVLLSFVLFIIVPVGCFMVGRMLAERVRAKQSV